MSREPNRNVYVGHRYVPKIMGEWDKQNEYEGLSIVTHQGASYTSKKRVPVGIDILNEEFWVVTGNYNAQVEYYRDDVNRISQDLKNKANINSTIISIEDFGGVGDGVTDNTKAFNDMLNSGHNVFYIPERNYSFNEELEIKRDNIKLISDGTLYFNKNESTAITITGNNNIISVNINGQDRVRIAVQNDGIGNVIQQCNIVNIKSVNDMACGINSRNNGHTIIKDNFINHVISTGNDVTGDNNGASRGIRITGLSTNNGNVDILNNSIKNILGEEGDSIHLNAPKKDVMNILVKNNHIYNFSRRAIKVQCSNVSIIDNYIECYTLYPGSIRAVDLQMIDNTLIEKNHFSLSNISAIGINGYENDYANNNLILGNHFNVKDSSTILYGSYSDNLIFKDNIIEGGGNIAYLRSKNSTFKSNVFNKSNVIENNVILNIGSETENIEVNDNSFRECISYSKIGINSINSKVLNNNMYDVRSRIALNGGNGIVMNNIIKNISENVIFIFGVDESNFNLVNNIQV